jgi:undecaprenyl-diphosphatase
LNLLSAILLGLVQGLTEFLPISSSAHIQIANELLNIDHAMTKPELTAFIATIQLGTEAAVLLFFWRDIVRIVKAWAAGLFSSQARNNPDSKLGWLIIIGSLPVIVIGLVFKDAIETTLRNLWVVGVTLIVFGLLLGWADRVATKRLEIKDLTVRHGLLYGLGQALAVIPGVSRSGGTISVGLLLGYSRQAAARYSFLLAIPAVLASGLYEFYKSYSDLNSSSLLATGVATLVSFITGFVVIGTLLRYLGKGSFMPFVVYRVAVGALVLIGLASGLLTA